MIQTTSNSIIQEKSLQEIGTFLRGTTTSQLHKTLNNEPIQDFIHQLTAKFFAHCPYNPNPPPPPQLNK
jgi:hypothetical protein